MEQEISQIYIPAAGFVHRMRCVLQKSHSLSRNGVVSHTRTIGSCTIALNAAEDKISLSLCSDYDIHSIPVAIANLTFRLCQVWETEHQYRRWPSPGQSTTI